MVPTDVDGDGVTAADGDCDDGDDTIFPGAPEAADGIDQDCDNVVDNGATNTFYADADDDGYGEPGSSEVACAPSSGFVPDGTDCDDAAPAVNPGATEACDEAFADEDCDASTLCTETAGLFDGDSIVTIPDSAALQQPAVTVEAWIQISAGGTAGHNALLRKGGRENAAGYEIGVVWLPDLSGTGDILPYFYGALGNSHGCDWTHAELTPGVAHHVFFQVSETGLFSLGIDGTYSACGTSIYDITAPGWDVEIGNMDASRPYGDIIDEVRISNVTRYTGPYAPERRFTTDPDTVALWHFDDAVGTTLTDDSASAAPGTITGAGYEWVLEPQASGPALRPSPGAVSVSPPRTREVVEPQDGVSRGRFAPPECRSC